MHLFLQGRSKIGKSTILHRVLHRWEASVAGFSVQRLVADGRAVGFRACVVEGCLPELQRPWADGLPDVFMTRGFLSQPVLDDAIEEARQAAGEAQCRLVLLDEIGGMELLSGRFMAALEGMLAAGKPCIGVIKSRENLSNTARRIPDAGDIFAARDRLEERIRQTGSVLTLTEENQPEIQRTVEEFVAKILP